MSGYRVEEVGLREMSDEAIAPLIGVVNRLEREQHPRHVDLSGDEIRMFAEDPTFTQRHFVVFDSDGDVVAIARARHPNDGTNPKTLMCQIRVLPEHRRHGIGTMLLGHLAEIAAGQGRTTLQGFHFDTVPAGRLFARSVGAVEKLDFHENVLRVAALDRDLLESWVENGPNRAPGYSVKVETVWPEGLFEDLAVLFDVLERDMPLSDSFEPREWNAQRVAELQDHYAEGVDALAAFVIHEATGKAVGMSEMIRRKTDPTTWMVTTTVVDPDHRGKSLGKWVKGVVNLAALERWEGGIHEETGNAFTNEPMLAINRAMGFEHELTMTDCSLDVAAALAHVGSRRAVNPGL